MLNVVSNKYFINLGMYLILAKCVSLFKVVAYI